jgi:transposase InsO family protein
MVEISQEALFRYLVVSQVLARIAHGEHQADGIKAVAAATHYSPVDGSVRLVATRSIYRWLAWYRKHDLAGLDPCSRAPHDTVSTVLSAEFIKLLRDEKAREPRTSIPEIIRTAREKGVLKPQDSIDRTTVYRTAKKLELPVGRWRVASGQDTRRFAYPHRLDMVLADGKHFRAGATRARRVALFFLDDATRFPLEVVVGTSESAQLFLHGLYLVLVKYGLMSIIYLDRGPGFIAEDTICVIANLGGLLIHGKAAYPEGHGKIERFNQTVLNDLLRGLDKRPDVDPDLRALELRIRHYLETQYSHRPHESLALQTPYERFHADQKPLRFPEDHDALRRKFEVTFRRLVSNDHIVSVDSLDYEMPRGCRGTTVLLRRKLLDGGIFFLHHGRLIELHPVDLTANARTRRAGGEPPEAVQHPPRTSAADLAFQRDYGPVVDPDGGYSNPQPQEEP